MQSLNALGNRQIASLNKDLVRMESGESGAAVQGQITTTLSALSRLINDYDSMAQKEMVTAAREKANTRVAKLKNEHKELKSRFERAKNESHAKVWLSIRTFCSSVNTCLQARSDLLGTASGSAPPFSPMGAQMSQRRAQPQTFAESPFASDPLFRPNNPPTDRENFALREHSFLQESENSIDQYISQGRAVLENLVEQRGMLKGTRTRLLNAANTLGMSRETIGWVERRTKQDAWIFGIGATITLFSFWVIWHYLG
ncbi:synaptobrevin [Cryptococcus wingfieldii CBS 7118]|uniref:Protein transport protein BOS1 n=1 Tax=Cryptococcus wingfieldii CBS 7118 TaxID=1295528 RepID=A0A1E3J055_9TREE|nr:synaptobrevin [Cryptococcus wingfieldii CBS 7118]ODN94257.1 synaptobrevin [Cryptococcus wingfieldii CBS 7118]